MLSRFVLVHHFNELLAMCIKHEVDFDLFSPTMHHSRNGYDFHFSVSLDLCLPALRSLVFYRGHI